MLPFLFAASAMRAGDNVMQMRLDAEVVSV